MNLSYRISLDITFKTNMNIKKFSRVESCDLELNKKVNFKLFLSHLSFVYVTFLHKSFNIYGSCSFRVPC